MSYGRSCPTVYVPFTFVCQECGVTVTIQIDAGKDYIWEDSCREAEWQMEHHCKWFLGQRKQDYKTVLCASCKYSTDIGECP